MSLKYAAAITGYAEYPPTRHPGAVKSLDILARVAREAVADAGFDKREIDGLLTTTPSDSYSMYFQTVLGEMLGLNLRYLDIVELGGASAAGMIWRAAAAINSGMCTNVLCIIAGTNAAGGTLDHGSLIPAWRAEFDSPYGMSQPNAGFAMAARRHMHEFGTTPEQMAKVAVDQRKNALQNPIALFNKEELTIDQVLNSPLIFDPLHLYEIVSRCSGGCAVIVSSKDLARRSRNKPVHIIGAGEAGTTLTVTDRKDFITTWAKDSSKAAYEMAGVSPSQMDFAQLYDCYTITVLLTIEDLGFCKKGQGGGFHAERDTTYAGDFPCNTNGGQLSAGQPSTAGGMIHVVEAARQLMGRGEGRQIKDASLGIVHNFGGILGESVSLVLSNQ